MRSSVALLFLAAAAISSSVHFAHCSSDSKAAQFTAAEAQVITQPHTNDFAHPCT